MYTKEQYLYMNNQNVRAVVRNYEQKDFAELLSIQKESFPSPFPPELLWNEKQLYNHISLFPDGALCVEINGVLAGSVTSLLVDYDLEHPQHTWEEITDNGYITNHDQSGNTLYVVDICIRPSHRKLNLGKLLMQSLYETVVHLKLQRLLGGGRMPGYSKHSHVLSPQDYADKVISGELYDPVISFLLRCGRNPLMLIPNYIEDEESSNYALLMEWRNPFL
ncbi:GNAT family N-acetyltransferase [Fictibacillus norfolkensis]|uniref:GNAT family N-acetyltransferase n=1 Tax=Fictibacillus norfolkensis TaxID=2762233 RepID=A0ABR8SGL4_9BACL|nr:GNAT family N-acetyltransferase [Fictibacillus norfolkensis]MBD7962622.1 GNAT family N-acetyltransferase [Fictibacillus norfolkensis]